MDTEKGADYQCITKSNENALQKQLLKNSHFPCTFKISTEWRLGPNSLRKTLNVQHPSDQNVYVKEETVIWR